MPPRDPSQPPTASRQFLMNLKVWAPYFSNRMDRDRLVRFSALDDRVGLKWTAAMPKQCWSCGQEEGVVVTEFKQSLRAYENPLAILSGMAAGAGIALLLFIFSLSMIPLLLLAVVLGIGMLILRLKSWDEEVRLAFFSCPTHAGELQRPPMAIEDQQLSVLCPTIELAAAAAAQNRAKRKRGMKPYDTDSETQTDPEPATRRSRPAPSAPHEVEQPARIERPQPVELPPIKLAGEEDEP